MAEEKVPFNIGIPIYDKVDLLDVAAPAEMFSWMGYSWEQDPNEKRTLSVKLIAASMTPLKTRDGLTLTPDTTFDDSCQLDLLWVPGGDPQTLSETMRDEAYINFLKRQSERATYVTSVCEGALLLASAGLLNGYEATTHWAFIPCLKSFPQIKVADGYPRYVVDRSRITGGGISSGLDEALKLIAIISGEETARQARLTTQYFPEPYPEDIPGSNDCPLPKTPDS